MKKEGYPRLEPHEAKKRKRERLAIFVIAITFVLLTIAEIKLTRVSNQLPFANSVFFFGLLNVNVLLLIALFWLIFRNIGKIILERRSRILGARLKTKLVVAFLGFSISPTLVLFLISSLYINQSFDQWFSLKVQNTLQASLEITRTYYRNAERTAKHFAEHLSKQIVKNEVNKKEKLTKPWDLEAPSWVREYMNQQIDLLALDAVEFYADPFDERILVIDEERGQNQRHYPRLSLDLLTQAFSGKSVSVIQHIGTGDIIRSLFPIYSTENKTEPIGIVTVNSYIPVSLVNKVDEIASVFDDYKQTNPLKSPIKSYYTIFLVMITLVLIAVAVSFGLYLARQLTVPVERLVKGAEEVGKGNLDVKIETGGQDEISVLIDSFNRMTTVLRDNRLRLTEANNNLEIRQQELEAVLANIGTGVIVIGKNGEVSTFNRAASQLLEVGDQNPKGLDYRQVFKGETAPLIELVNKAFRNSQVGEKIPTEMIHWHLKSQDQVKSLAGVATPLADEESNWGVVVVIEDMSHLIKAQREVAWREVARRIAHEIKNPLTPIKLSAQRLKRRLGELEGKDGEVLRECTDVIVQHTDELKEMVNEFSNFARLPEISPAPGDLNQSLSETVTLYSQAHGDIEIQFRPDPSLKAFEFDKDQIKRVFINILDNAVSAIQHSQSGQKGWIKIETHYRPDLQIAQMIFEDNGPGMDEATKSRLFEPYFSTKSGGTGLGLAIAKRIINDHDGFIRVDTQANQGSKFILEIPTTVKHLKKKVDEVPPQLEEL